MRSVLTLDLSSRPKVPDQQDLYSLDCFLSALYDAEVDDPTFFNSMLSEVKSRLSELQHGPLTLEVASSSEPGKLLWTFKLSN